MTTFDLLLVGFGNVARRFVSLLAEHRAGLARDFGVTTRVVGIATRRHGRTYAAAGLSSAALPATGPGLPSSSTLAFLHDALTRSAASARQRRLVVIETTTLDIARGEPAISHIRAALAGGAHVVTANKGPVP